jgi:hypothetical protein
MSGVGRFELKDDLNTNARPVALLELLGMAWCMTGVESKLELDTSMH